MRSCPVVPTEPVSTPQIDAVLSAGVQQGRVAIDSNIFLNSNRKYDDIGFFDAVTLALPYEQLLPKNDQGQI